ncbi:hypothetical protein Vadar_032465 [Vaccinium darrowii]|uniref:Uncharacterized protein n=1 Tax=Vaccinium darrowii TaxID=229202 RepID=A0ACB7XV07_9ERIC|nr:hypothetical protein Vadar_032465 [Vaccinium darrowii]
MLPDGSNGHGNGLGEDGPGGSLLTVVFQILLDSTPNGKLSLGSIATVNNLINCKVDRIKASVAGNNPLITNPIIWKQKEFSKFVRSLEHRCINSIL